MNNTNKPSDVNSDNTPDRSGWIQRSIPLWSVFLPLEEAVKVTDSEELDDAED